MPRKHVIGPSPSAVEWIEREAWIDIYEAAPAAVNTALKLHSTLIGETPVFACLGIPISELNRAFMLDDLAKPKIDDAAQWLEDIAAPNFALQIAANDTTAELQAWARRNHFEPFGNGWSKLTKNIAFDEEGDLVQNERISFTTDPDPALYGRLVVSAMGLPEAAQAWFSALVGRPNWTTIVAMLDGEPVGSGALFVKDTWAWFGIDGTIDSARRQGVQAALIQFRIRSARKLGAFYLTAETGRPEKADGKHTSRQNYIRNGFSEAYHRLNFKTKTEDGAS
ncbi:GNAT family N-acetyltransferase [Rhizobium sp. BK251]|uniref:GNAT family N-acetyltransferase n=1 Tax=Rhizobium sp. BK251 TaxID=2512125 RepID=UPI00104393AE|nr:GNAT family N-acetyltransferase [Rhizobium sp. BK251]TCL71030.1 hypothetical protein EV286_1063 [Rhizobium sp. BK251]